MLKGGKRRGKSANHLLKSRGGERGRLRPRRCVIRGGGGRREDSFIRASRDRGGGRGGGGGGGGRVRRRVWVGEWGASNDT